MVYTWTLTAVAPPPQGKLDVKNIIGRKIKNRLFERHRRLQKERGTQPRSGMTDGVVVRHCYGGEKPDALAWWDDTGFNLNGVHVAVWWVHPRMRYQNEVAAMAHEKVPFSIFEIEGVKTPGLFDGAKPVHKRVGKSGKRKKISGFTLNSPLSESRSAWYAAITLETDRLLRDNGLVVTPSIKIEALSWCRGVSICAPLEIRGVEDLKKLCSLVKSLLKGQTSMDREFPGFAYTRADWVRENPVLAADPVLENTPSTLP